jgi:glycosyltransferase involved in cell wall biosynthesis
VNEDHSVRVLYSFPHKLGAARICYTAWQQVSGLAAAGAKVRVFPGAVYKPVLSERVEVAPTLARGKLRIPYSVLGMGRACMLHDWVVARRLERLVGEIDVIHVWPFGALRTLETAARLGIPAVLERPNAHSRYAYSVVAEECERIGVTLPPGSEHRLDENVLAREEAEYNAAYRLLCPSDFVVGTFLERGFAPEKLVRHQYGYDPGIYGSDPAHVRGGDHGLTVLFAGLCAVRKGLHFALEAWLCSPAHKQGKFLIAGEFLPEYAQKLAPMLSHPSVEVLGHRDDLPQLMRNSDIVVLPSIEEGSALVTSEARGSGCVLLVSEAAGAICEHNVDALVHRVGDVDTLTQHFAMLHQDRGLLDRLRLESLRTLHEITWQSAGCRLLKAYEEVIAAYHAESESRSAQVGKKDRPEAVSHPITP